MAQGTFANTITFAGIGLPANGHAQRRDHEVHLYNRALADSEIGQLAALQTPTNGLTARWGFELNGDSDKSGKNRTGTPVGTTAPATGLAGDALWLTGNGYMSVPPLALNGDFTVTLDSFGLTTSGSLNGALNEVHVYDRALSGADLANLAQTAVR